MTQARGMLMWFLLAGLLLVAGTPRAWSASGTLLYSFSAAQGLPESTLIRDSAGNLYGTTSDGGKFGGGIVYQLSPAGNGAYTLTTLHDFDNNGLSINASGRLTLGPSGALFGTTEFGGAFGNGQVYELSPGGGNGTWNFRVLYSFSSSFSGINPLRGVTRDSSGNFFGTTTESDLGPSSVFELSPNGVGGYKQSTVHRFVAPEEGTSPSSEIYIDAAGNLYGTTASGGTNGRGTFYRVQPQPGGGWKASTLHNFGSGLDGATPIGTLTADAAGNFYGTTYNGGASGHGTVYQLSADGKEKVLRSFAGVGGDTPQSGVVIAADGTLYGTTLAGGKYDDGIIFSLTPANGQYTAKLLHTFQDAVDGSAPLGVVLDGAGNLYGVTASGGPLGFGTAYKFTP